MVLKCIIIEDQPPAQRILKTFISKVEHLELIKIFSEAYTAQEFLEKNNIDLIFLDIHLPRMSGIEFLKTMPNHPSVILTTAFSDYAIESYEYNVIDYLLKPFSFERFSMATDKAKKTIPYQNKKFIHVKSGYDIIKVLSDDILYLKSDGDYTEIVTLNKTHLSADTLKVWLEKLDDSFLQIHKSYIVNSTHILKVSSNKLLLVNDIKTPLGRAFKKRFLDKYLE